MGIAKDVYGILNSGLCMVHCLAMPMLISLGSGFLTQPWVEPFFIAAAGWAVHRATGQGTPHWLRWGMWVMWVLFAVSLLMEERAVLFEWTGLSASVGLIVGHAANILDRSHTSSAD